MKTRIYKIYDKWCVEFPFAVTVYCPNFRCAMEEFGCYFDYRDRAHRCDGFVGSS